jgi:hypothetical protein
MIARSSHILLLAFLAFPTAQNARATTAAQLRQKAAEEEADRVMRRFYDTLDFGVIYREMYVSEPLKSREVRATIRATIRQHSIGTPAPTFDFAALERAYIAWRNFDFLVSAQNFTYDGDEETFKKEAEQQLMLHYMPMLSPANSPILTSEELDSRLTANLNHLSEFWRRFVVKENFETDLYRKRISLFEESRSPEESFVKQIGLGRKIYVVRRERLYLYLVEENNKFRMLSVTPRVQD